MADSLAPTGVPRPRGAPAPAHGTARPPAVVEQWLVRNSFDAREFSDRHALLSLKRAQGVTISLGLPALNEEATIGREIEVLRQTLVTEVPLLDEIVVIDGGSDDGTTALARRLGIPTYRHADILPEQGTHPGKGEALWKSLHVLRGDLIVWVDSDIRNIHPKFVYGLVGPLLREPRLAYVKGFYRRPIRIGNRQYDDGGGRVTELTARPLLNLFFPELSGLVQPLAGEYAGRREVLEQLPFFTGYGVEIGLLIDALARFGLHRIGQVNLGSRVHRNRELPSLSIMAFAIVQTVMTRLGESAGAPIAGLMHRAMKLVNTDDPVSFRVHLVQEHERPPIITVPAYRHKRAPALSGAPETG
jgi:hypothetical protein